MEDPQIMKRIAILGSTGSIGVQTLDVIAAFPERYSAYSLTVNTRIDLLEKQIDDEISKAEKEIKILRDNAPDKINKIAIETSSELIKKLIGTEVNNSSISAIVDDLSKKNGDKYYGN